MLLITRGGRFSRRRSAILDWLGRSRRPIELVVFAAVVVLTAWLVAAGT